MAIGWKREDQPSGAGSALTEDTPSRPFVFDVSEIPGRTNVEILGDTEETAPLLEVLGRDLVTRTLVQTPTLCVYHETAAPGARVAPHRHGTHQVMYVLRGALFFGAKRVGPGMGYFTPDKPYSWRAGEAGAEWIEIHSGLAGIFTDPGGA